MRITNLFRSFIILILILAFTTEGWSFIRYMNLDRIKNNSSCVYREGEAFENGCSEMRKYKAAAFLSFLIYEGLNARDTSSNFYYGKYKYATLWDYINKVETGFTGGLFITNDNRFFIVFGGTTANSYDGSDYDDSTLEKVKVPFSFSKNVNDVFVDMNLLNHNYEPLHIKLAMEFAQKSLETIRKMPGRELNFQNTFVVGHSLGGGLAQLVALSKGLKAVTFNTAPAPVTEITKKYLLNDYLENENQIINIMAINDPLTTVLEHIEKIESNEHLLNRSMRYNMYFQGSEDLYSVIQTSVSFLNNTAGRLQINLKSPFYKVLDIFSETEIQSFYSSINEAIKEMSSGDEDISKAIFFELIRLLKANNVEEMIPYLKELYGIPQNQKLTKLIYGKRLLLSNETGHSMFHLINEAYQNVNDFNLNDLLLPGQTIFKDVKKYSSFFTPISILEKEKVVSGRKINYFDVNGDISRAEFYGMINKYLFHYDYNEILAQIHEGGYLTVIDVNYKPIKWQKAHARYLRRYFKKNWHYSAPDNLNYDSSDENDELEFLNMSICREEVSKILFSIIRSEINEYIHGYPSPTRCDDWTIESKYLKDIGLINGYPDDGCFKPKNFISRGEASAVLVKVKQFLDRY